MRQAELFAMSVFPDGFSYTPEFLGEAEESRLLAAIRALPLHEARYKAYTARRRTASFGFEYDFDGNKLLQGAPLPEFLAPLRQKVSNWLDIPATQFGHALITEYQPGTALGWHRDVPNFEVVAGISLCGRCRMRFRPYPPRKGKSRHGFDLDLEPRSAYVLRGEARWGWQHSIPPTKELRYSITFRTLAEQRGQRRSSKVSVGKPKAQ